MENTEWKGHYNKLEKSCALPSTTLCKAIQLINEGFGPPRGIQAVDLGCGNGVDTAAMLQEGYHVLAIDKEPDALRHIAKTLAPRYSGKLRVLLSPFEDLDELPANNLVNASFCLPFCPPDHFAPFWSLISQSILPGRYFSGHFFGPRDSWSSNTQMTFHTKQAVEALFRGFQLSYFEETAKNGKTISGKDKFWHVFHVVAQKEKVLE